MNCVRMGIVGVGNMGTVHAAYIQKGEVARCRLTAVCDTDPARLTPFADLKTFTDSRDLIRSGEVDAVIVATPHYSHTPIGIDMLEQGLHLLMEKPISVHKADCHRLIAAHTGRNKQVFGAMFQLRTQPVYKRLRDFIARGELGKIQRVNWTATAWFRTEAYYASSGWRATWKGEGGGVLMNQCPHNLDLFQWIFGMPATIRASAAFGKYHNIEVEDEVTAYIEFPNGATGVFIAGTGEAPGTDRLEVVGDRGRLVLEGGRLAFDRNEIGAREFSATSKAAFDAPEKWNVEIPVKEQPNGHYLVTQAFVDAILDGAPLIAPGEDGIHSVELANAMIFSAIHDRTVSLPLDERAYEDMLDRLIRESRFEKKTVKETTTDMGQSFR